MTITLISSGLAPEKAHQTTSDWVEWQIVHQIPGRLRLRIPRLSWDTAYSRRLARLLLQTTAITENRINSVAASLVVSYAEEMVSETAIKDYLETIILACSRNSSESTEILEIEPKKTEKSWEMPALAMIIAIAATPLDLPFFVVGGIIFIASLPLWQRVGESVSQQGQVTIDCLDALWLTTQILQENGVAGAMALNFAGIGESLRKNKLEQLEHELYALFDQEDQEIHWLSERQRFAPVPESDREWWLHSVEETELLQKIKPIAQGAIAPTLLLSGILGIITGDLGRASAVLPLDFGVSLRGVTPLAVVSALTAAARQGVYIRNGRVLEKLAQVDTLVVPIESLYGEKTRDIEKNQSSLLQWVQNWQAQGFNLHLMIPENGTEGLADAERWGIPLECVHLVSSDIHLAELQERLQSKSRGIAWITDNGNDFLKENPTDVIISLAKEDFEAQADVVLHHYDYQSLGYTIALARHTLANAYGSLAIATIPNLLAVAVGVFWGLNPIIAVIINGSSAILAEFNSLRPLNIKLGYNR